MSKKFSLVKFVEDDILYVAPTKKIKIISNDLVKAPYKNMGCYEAILIRDHDDKLVLEKFKEEMTESAEVEGEAENISTGEVNAGHEHEGRELSPNKKYVISDDEDDDDSLADPDFEPRLEYDEEFRMDVENISSGQRIRWSPEEKEIVFKAFESELSQKKIPTLARCKEVIEKNPILQKRTREQLKAFINNVIKKST